MLKLRNKAWLSLLAPALAPLQVPERTDINHFNEVCRVLVTEHERHRDSGSTRAANLLLASLPPWQVWWEQMELRMTAGHAVTQFKQVFTPTGVQKQRGSTLGTVVSLKGTGNQTEQGNSLTSITVRQ